MLVPTLLAAALEAGRRGEGEEGWTSGSESALHSCVSSHSVWEDREDKSYSSLPSSLTLNQLCPFIGIRRLHSQNASAQFKPLLPANKQQQQQLPAPAHLNHTPFLQPSMTNRLQLYLQPPTAALLAPATSSQKKQIISRASMLRCFPSTPARHYSTPLTIRLLAV